MKRLVLVTINGKSAFVMIPQSTDGKYRINQKTLVKLVPKAVEKGHCLVIG